MTKIDTAVLFPTRAEAAAFPEGYGASVFICGIGAVECAAATAHVIARYHPQRMVLAGIAGAYPGSGLETGQAVAVAAEYAADLGTLRPEGFCAIGNPGDVPRYRPNEALPGLPAVASNTVGCAGTPYLHRAGEASARIENMEGAAFMAVCARLGVPRFAEVRTVSNRVGDPPRLWNIPLAVERLAAVLSSLLTENPDPYLSLSPATEPTQASIHTPAGDQTGPNRIPDPDGPAPEYIP